MPASLTMRATGVALGLMLAQELQTQQRSFLSL